jgi:hypothetical protein
MSLSEVALVRDKNWTEGGTSLGMKAQEKNRIVLPIDPADVFGFVGVTTAGLVASPG